MPTSELLAMADPNAHLIADSASATTGQRDFPQLARRSNGLARENRESWLNRMLRGVFGWSPTSIRSDLKVLLDGTAAETGFSPDESRMLKNILSLRERRLDDLMVPRADIVAVQQDIPLGELVKVFENATHSRLVVYNDTLDEPVGMVHIRDLIAFMTARATVQPAANAAPAEPLPAGLNFAVLDLAMPLSAAKIIRTILFVPPSMPAIDLLAKMQATHIHLALVIDEYGGTDGLASIEDIVEEIVGDITDEHDVVVPGVRRQPDGSVNVDGGVPIRDLNRVMDWNLPDDEATTVAGLVIHEARLIPEPGQTFTFHGFRFRVLRRHRNRITVLRITPLARKPAAAVATASRER
jgi:CBS domain containing-hemolysin-like protein